MSIEPYRLLVPARTSSPMSTSAGTDSPVTADLSIEELPATTVPSRGTVSPGNMRTMFPTWMLSTSVETTSSPETRFALSTFSFPSASMPARACEVTRVSMSSPKDMITDTSAAAMYSSSRMHPMMADTTRVSAEISLFSAS